jgi:hypothetical protein
MNHGWSSVLALSGKLLVMVAMIMREDERRLGILGLAKEMTFECIDEEPWTAFNGVTVLRRVHCSWWPGRDAENGNVV